MGRAPCCDKANVKKGPWSPEEDTKLKEYIEKYGTGGNWIALPYKAGLRRCGKSCRLRWLNYLRPNIKHGQFSDDEDRIICNLYASIGSRWSIIAAQLPGRTDNDIKNYWNTKLKKKFMGIIPPSQMKTLPPNFQSSFQTASTYQNSINFYSLSKSPHGLEALSIPSNFLNSDKYTTRSTLTSLHESQENLVGLMHNYGENENLLMFGGEPSCSSSDGSCNQMTYNKDIEYECNGSGGHHGVQVGSESYFFNGISENQKGILASGPVGGNNGWTNGFWGENPLPLDYGLEDIKQLVSTNDCSNFFSGETKTQGRIMYF
ncbi:hypothetical protein IFM89_010667 [Coptis chinensis]|uniref:Uncharacterized protein n=1 Tax=Coptis chinensis TaxID=261450 RepID=A0A835HDZ9_9MAGN|nr:hypothetical protein IFM89_010667 [Coptis chinensis]